MAERLRLRDQASIEKQRVALRYRAIADLGGNLIGKGAKWGSLGFIAYQARLAIESLAGRVTVAELIFALGTNVAITITVSWTVTVGATVLLLRERRLRRTNIKRLAGRIEQYEKIIDEKRSSSLLTAAGRTRPEDES